MIGSSPSLRLRRSPQAQSNAAEVARARPPQPRSRGRRKAPTKKTGLVRSAVAAVKGRSVALEPATPSRPDRAVPRPPSVETPPRRYQMAEGSAVREALAELDLEELEELPDEEVYTADH